MTSSSRVRLLATDLDLRHAAEAAERRMMRFPQAPGAVIFDMDGLLIDTVPLYASAMVDAGLEIGSSVSREYVLSLVGLLGDELHARLQTDQGSSFPVARFLTAMTRRVSQLLAGSVALKRGAREIVTGLASDGVTLAVATSMTHADAAHHLETTGLRPFFRVVATRDDVERGKPHPDVYLRAAQDLAVDPSCCVALEDSFAGVRAAHAAGAMTIMVPDVLRPTPEIEALCVAIASDLAEAAELLRGSRAS